MTEHVPQCELCGRELHGDARAYLCPGCTRATAEQLQAMPGLYATLEAFLAPGRRGGGGGGRVARTEAPLPVCEPVLDLRGPGGIVGILEGWRSALHETLGCPEDIQWGRLIRAAEQTAAGRRTWRDKAHEMEADAVQARQGQAADERAEKAEAEVKRLSAKLTAAQAENDGLAECMRNTDRLTTAEATELRIRAERAEATLTAVRRLAGWAINGWSDLSPEKVLAALGDPQPATDAHTRLSQEIDAAPLTLPVIDLAARDLINLIRRIARTGD